MLMANIYIYIYVKSTGSSGEDSLCAWSSLPDLPDLVVKKAELCIFLVLHSATSGFCPPGLYTSDLLYVLVPIVVRIQISGCCWGTPLF